MNISSTAFDRYRHSANGKTSLPRLLAGSLIIAVCWLAVTGAVIFGGVYLYAVVGPWFGPETLTFDQGGVVTRFLASPFGVIATLLTFAGIWLGVWIAMKFLHREPVSHLFGASFRLSRSGFVNGLIAVLLTSALDRNRLLPSGPRIPPRFRQPERLVPGLYTRRVPRLYPDIVGRNPVSRLSAARPGGALSQSAGLGADPGAPVHGAALERRRDSRR